MRYTFTQLRRSKSNRLRSNHVTINTTRLAIHRNFQVRNSTYLIRRFRRANRSFFKKTVYIVTLRGHETHVPKVSSRLYSNTHTSVIHRIRNQRKRITIRRRRNASTKYFMLNRFHLRHLTFQHINMFAFKSSSTTQPNKCKLARHLRLFIQNNYRTSNRKGATFNHHLSRTLQCKYRMKVKSVKSRRRSIQYNTFNRYLDVNIKAVIRLNNYFRRLSVQLITCLTNTTIRRTKYNNSKSLNFFNSVRRYH